jgi:N-acyl amino acid synthase of PEP-CTERM/exosortase system
LPALYNEHFDVVRVRSARLLDAVYRLRYQVYCVEHPFESAAEHPDGREIDPYDAHSIHAALLHRESGTVVGTVRIVLPHPERGLAGLPLLQLVDEPVRHRLSALAEPGVAEVSRYAVSKLFRTGEPIAGDKAAARRAPGSAQRLMPYLTLGLLRAMMAMCREQGIAYMAAVMEPTLLRLLTRFGVHFLPIGPLVDYHGLRQPSLLAVDAMEDGIINKSRDFGEIVCTPMGEDTDSAALVAAE